VDRPDTWEQRGTHSDAEIGERHAIALGAHDSHHQSKRRLHDQNVDWWKPVGVRACVACVQVLSASVECVRVRKGVKPGNQRVCTNPPPTHAEHKEEEKNTNSQHTQMNKDNVKYLMTVMSATVVQGKRVSTTVRKWAREREQG
jgi:hypothetical protein